MFLLANCVKRLIPFNNDAGNRASYIFVLLAIISLHSIPKNLAPSISDDGKLVDGGLENMTLHF